MIPTTVVALVIVGLFFVPGYLTLLVWNRNQGWTPRADLQLFATTLVVSALCHLPFFWLVPYVLRWNQQGHLRDAGPAWVLMGWFLAVALVMPVTYGLLADTRLENPTGFLAKKIAGIFPVDRVRRAPTSWDAVWTARKGWFIVAGLSGGRIIGGKFGQRSAVAFWRDGHDLFLEEEWSVNEDGRFSSGSKKVAGTQGIWVGGSSLEWVRFVAGE